MPIKKGQQESHLQRICVRWFRINPQTRNHLIFSIPNEAKRSKIAGGVMVQQGLISGLPDCVIILQGGYVFMIELKAGSNKLTPKQAEMHERLRALGIKVYVCYNLDEFINAVEKELERLILRA